MRHELEIGGRKRQIDVRSADGRFVVTVEGRTLQVEAARIDAWTMSLLVADGTRTVSREVTLEHDRLQGAVQVHVGAAVVPVVVNGTTSRGRPHDRGSAAGPQRIVAPMPGRIVRLLVKAGDHVSAHQPVVVIEAMKMENELRAGRDGVAVDVPVRPGQSVEAGAILVVLAARQGA